MPYPNEHSARIADSGKYSKIRRQNDKFGPGIDAIFGVTEDGKTEVQSIRFDKKRYTPRRAQAWLKKHNYSASLEAASGETKKALFTKQDLEEAARMMDLKPSIPVVPPHTGVMIALKIPEYLRESLVLPPDSVAPPGHALPKEELHVTLAYLGDISEQTYVKEKLVDYLKRYTADQYPIIASLNGVARFSNIQDDGTQAFVTLVDSPALPQFRQNIMADLKWQDIDSSNKHGFTPHITLAYLPVGVPNPHFSDLEIPLVFDTIFLAWGEERIEFQLQGGKSSSLAVLKQANGKYRWVMFSSNAFRDRDGEIVSEKALREDVERADRDSYYGPLRWWHMGDYDYKEVGKWETSFATDGLDVGDCDFNMMSGKILIESGTFRYPDVAERVKENQENLQGSIMFSHPVSEPDKDGAFSNIRRIERSILPKGKASNPFVQLVVEGDNSMKFKEKFESFLAILGGDVELAQKILANAKSIEKAAQDAGIAFKELETDEDTTDTTEKETKEESTEVKTPETKVDPVETEKAKAEEKPEDKKEEEKKPAEKPTDEKKPMQDEMREGEEDDYMGDMKKKDFAEMVMKCTAAVLEPFEQKMMGMMNDRMGKKEVTDAATLKEYGDKLNSLEKAMGNVAVAVKELQGDIPKAFAGGYRASQSKDTEITEKEAKEKGAPTVDPVMQTLDSITKMVMGQQ